MIKKSDWLLALLYAPGITKNANEPIEGSVKIMKGLFLIKQELTKELSGFYEFEPYLYGPCSFEVYRDLLNLKARGLLNEIRVPNKRWYIYTLTKAGKMRAERVFGEIPKNAKEKLTEVKKRINELSFLSLLELIYKNYPEYAKNTVIRILS